MHLYQSLSWALLSLADNVSDDKSWVPGLSQWATRYHKNCSTTWQWIRVSYYNDAIISAVASHIIVVTIVSSGADQRKKCSASLFFLGEFTGDRWIPARRSSNAENISIWWHHQGAYIYIYMRKDINGYYIHAFSPSTILGWHRYITSFLTIALDGGLVPNRRQAIR